MIGEWKDKIFTVTPDSFESLALEVFRFQFHNNQIYRSFVSALRLNPETINTLEKIPFLPIGFFKSHEVKSGDFAPELVFESSGTSQMLPSRHFVKEAALYEKSFTLAFENVFGAITDWCILGLLPSYLERKNSSLVFMVNQLIRQSQHPQSGFYLDEFEKLAEVLSDLEIKKQKTILLGVTFALLDFSRQYPLSLRHTLVMETGGMKGRKKEMTRAEVHDMLKKAFSKDHIYSEYGMTELLSQAYSKANGLFQCPPWMKVLIRDEEDPLQVGRQPGQNGALNIIDLANIYSCSFLATDDLGKLHNDEQFEVLGRKDGSDLRGCSLMMG